MVVDAKRLAGTGPRGGLQAAQTVRGGVVHEYDRIGGVEEPVVPRRLVALREGAVELEELELLRGGVLVDDPHLVAEGPQVAPQPDLLALGAILIVMGFWRKTGSFWRHAYVANVVLMTLGFVLTGYQLVGYFVA